jgi:hypothetical protein
MYPFVLENCNQRKWRRKIKPHKILILKTVNCILKQQAWHNCVLETPKEVLATWEK